jgi:hypothetical protein
MTVMSHLVDKRSLARANGVLLLTLVGGGLAACAVGAVVYDLVQLFSAW